MPVNSSLLPLLICPSTKLSLLEDEGYLHTTQKESDRLSYPIIDGIPWLLPNPQNSLIDWSIKLNHFYQILSDEINTLDQAFKSSSGATQDRLGILLTGKQKFIRTVFDLMAPVVQNPMAQKSTYDALNDQAPNTQNLLSYEANLYRDWVWGEEENNLSFDIINQHIDSLKEKKLLVLGAGSGRLAWDIHHQYSPAITVATDINPLLVLATQRLLNGKELSIFEFPLQPRTTQNVAIEHTIAPLPQADNFHYIFSDATKPAFIKNAFDTVVTPWFIDIQPLELSRFLQQLNQYIDVGNQWINFGSLVFHQNRDALCYSIEEVKAIAAQQGFEITDIQESQIPYLKSPYNAGHRVENVWSWTATKTHDVEPIKQTQHLPPWILDLKKPIPKADYFQQFTITHRLYALLSADVDGRTSLTKIANKLAKQQKMHPDEALNLVRNLFIDLYTQHN
jgi:uncharacterized protein YbaR (Trm112 family)